MSGFAALALLREGVQALGLGLLLPLVWSIFGDAHHSIVALLHEHYGRCESHKDLTHAHCRGSAGMLSPCARCATKEEPIVALRYE